ncbi:MAG TPA: hypothetical protein GXX75_14000 [Clostridiales bacterium]|nr:hypothetical protein [Clostridiales bacterium]
MDTIAACGFRRLTIEDKTWFDSFFLKMNDNWASTLSFSSMIAWNSSIHIYHRVLGEYLWILAHDTTCGHWYTIPLLGHYEQESLEESMRELLGQMEKLQLPVHFVSVSGWMLPYYKSLKCVTFQESYDSKLSDYIYGVDDFIKAGNSQKSRYDYKYFVKNYNPAVFMMDSSNADRYADFTAKRFCCSHECSVCVYGCQLETIRNITRVLEMTGAKGIAVYHEGELIGYEIVSREKTQLVYHFKENSRKYRGLGAFLNWKCYELFGGDARYINYTEDMGLEGLKKYKQQLAAYHLSHKYELLRVR